MKKYYKISIIILVAAAFNGQMDHLQFHDTEYDPANTWQNKYAKDVEGGLIPLTSSPWYYAGLYRPAYKEAFPYSSTAFVAFTDPWHRAKALCFACWRTAIVLLLAFHRQLSRVRWKNIALYIGVWWGVWAVQALGFHLVYTILN